MRIGELLRIIRPLALALPDVTVDGFDIEVDALRVVLRTSHGRISLQRHGAMGYEAVAALSGARPARAHGDTPAVAVRALLRTLRPEDESEP